VPSFALFQPNHQSADLALIREPSFFTSLLPYFFASQTRSLNRARSRLLTIRCSLLTASSNPQRRIILIRVRLILQLVQHPGVIHHFQVIQHAEHIHVAQGLRRFPQHGW